MRKEQSSSLTLNEILSTKAKKCLFVLGASGIFTFGAAANGGICLYPCHGDERPFEYSDQFDYKRGRVLINIDNFYNEERDYKYYHRVNTVKDINDAFEDGVNVFEIDVNDVDGIPFAEHGDIVKVKNPIGPDLYFVGDTGELELGTRLPQKLEDLIKHVSLLSTKENPLGVHLDLKNKFGKDALKAIVDLLYEYNVPAFIDPAKVEYQQALRNFWAEKIATPPIPKDYEG